MTWRRESFRSHYRDIIGTVGASNSYVSYLNLVDDLVGGLDERIAAVGGMEVELWLGRQPDQRFSRARSRRNCTSALRAYLSFADGPRRTANPIPIPPTPVRGEVVDILREAKALASRYYRLVGKPLGVTGEVAELEAAEKLGLVLLDARSPDVDALRGGTWGVQIKGRAVVADRRYGGRCPSIKGDRFDSVVLVLLDRTTYEALEIWEAPRDRVLARITAPGSKARNERRSLGIAQFRSIAEKVWSAASES